MNESFNKRCLHILCSVASLEIKSKLRLLQLYLFISLQNMNYCDFSLNVSQLLSNTAPLAQTKRQKRVIICLFRVNCIPPVRLKDKGIFIKFLHIMAAEETYCNHETLPNRNITQIVISRSLSHDQLWHRIEHSQSFLLAFL